MPTLDEKQRAWLDAALKAKGRFTRKKSVEKDWEKYRGRRAKTATALEDLDAAASQRPIVEQALKDADALAETGKFSNAYKALDSAKKLAKTTSGKRLDAIATATLDAAAQDIRQKLNTVFPPADFAISSFNMLIAKMDKTAKVADQPTLKAAIARRQAFADEEIVLEAEFTAAWSEANRAAERIQANKPRETIAAAEEKIAMFERAGLGAQIAAQKAAIAGMKDECEEFGGRYADPAVIKGINETRSKEFRAKLHAIKDFGAYQARAGKQSRPDDATDGVRGDLVDTGYLEDLEAKEKARKDAVVLHLRLDKLLDDVAFDDKAPGTVRTAPEPTAFDPDTAFGNVLDDEIPDDITLQQTDAIVTKAAANMRTFVQNVPANSPELFDLMMMSKKDLAKMANAALTGVDSPKGISESHKLMLARMSDELGQIIRDNCPNKMADDLSEITIGGEKYLRDRDLGAGVSGIARRFRKASDPSQTIVVKSLHCDDPAEFDEKRDAMAEEMRTNQRLSSVNDGNPGADNLLAMSGAALSGDGTLHMVMEDAGAGDIAGVGNALSTLTNLGIIPPEAQAALSRDLLQQTVMGMKAMAARGMVHNDLKPDNMLMTADGKVKIMDFGESRFGDDKGQTPSRAMSEEQGNAFAATAGYEAPEQMDAAGKVTARVDTYALGNIAKMLSAPDYSADVLDRDEKPVSAVGRLVAAATSDNPDDRPSLDAILASTLLQANAEDHTPQDIEDLRAATLGVTSTMSVVKADLDLVNLPMPDLMADDAETEDYEALRRAMNLLLGRIGGTVASLGDLQFLIKVARDRIDSEMAFMAKAAPQSRKAYRKTIKIYTKALKFLAQKEEQAFQDAKAEGQRQIDARIADATQKIDVPGTGGGSFTVKDALKKREILEVEIRTMQDMFYATAEADPETALANLDGTNQRLQEMAGQITAIDAGLKAKVGPEGRFLLAERKLAEIGARFGPSRQRRPDNDGRATPGSFTPARGARLEPEEKDEEDVVDVDAVLDKEDVLDEIRQKAGG